MGDDTDLELGHNPDTDDEPDPGWVPLIHDPYESFDSRWYEAVGVREHTPTHIARTAAEDARRDRIVRAAEAFEACERDATDVASLAWANARRELMAAVAAGRETT